MGPRAPSASRRRWARQRYSSTTKKTLLIGPLSKLGTLGKPAPLRHSENEFLVSVTLISVPTQLVLDTGTNSTNLSWKTWEKLARVWTPKQIVEGITNYYQTAYPEIYNGKRALVEQSADNVARIYLRNIFPVMRVTWAVHPNNLGHTDFPGCFRCHDGSHTSADGQTIANDCTACHSLVAVQEENPKILTNLGLQ